MRLKIAAKVDAVDAAYFRDVIKPLLADPLIEFIGEIGDSEKSAFLGNAAALLFPIDWPEPFGLVLIEAMACGTPVIAWRCGSVSEIIEDGRTGFIVDTEDDLQPLVWRAFTDACRGVELTAASMADAAFDVDRMRSRASEGWVTVTELADTLSRDHGLAFTAAATALVQRRAGGPTRAPRSPMPWPPPLRPLAAKCGSATQSSRASSVPSISWRFAAPPGGHRQRSLPTPSPPPGRQWNGTV